MKRAIAAAILTVILSSPAAAHVSERCVVDLAVSSETFSRLGEKVKALDVSWNERAPRDELWRNWQAVYFTIVLQTEAFARFVRCMNES